MRFRKTHLALIAASISSALIGSAARAAIIDFEDVITPGLGPGAEITVTVPDDPALQVSRGFNFDWAELPTGLPPQFPQFDTHGHISRAGDLEGSADVWVASSDPLAADPRVASTTYVVTDDSFAADNFLRISPVDTTATFSIQSFDIAEAFSPAGSAQTISVTGFLDDGDNIADLFLVDVPLTGEDFASSPTSTVFTGFQTVTFGAEWTGLSSVVFDGNGATDPQTGNPNPRTDYYAIDNIVVNEPVTTDPDDQDDQGDQNGRDRTVGVPEPSSLAIFGVGAMAFGWVVRRRRAAC